MKNLIVASAFAAASFLSPAVLLVATPAAAIDCSDPDAPESRPGGPCELLNSEGKGSLTEPGTEGAPPVVTPPCVGFTDLGIDLRLLNKGERILVADFCAE